MRTHWMQKWAELLWDPLLQQTLPGKQPPSKPNLSKVLGPVYQQQAQIQDEAAAAEQGAPPSPTDQETSGMEVKIKNIQARLKLLEAQARLKKKKKQLEAKKSKDDEKPVKKPKAKK